MSDRSTSGARINWKLSGVFRNTLTDTTIPQVSQPDAAYNISLTDGVQASQANRVWQSKSRELSSGANEVLDLYDMGSIDIGGGAGADALGQPVDFEEIVAILITNDNGIAADGQLEIEPDATAGWTPIGIHTAATGGALRGQGCLAKAQPAEAAFDVEDAVSHRIKITANGGDITYSIFIFARNDDDDSSSSSSSSSNSSSSSQSSSSSST